MKKHSILFLTTIFLLTLWGCTKTVPPQVTPVVTTTATTTAEATTRKITPLVPPIEAAEEKTL